MSKILDFFKKLPTTDNGRSLLGALASVLVGLVFGFILMLIFGGLDAFTGLYYIALGPLSKGMESLGEVLAYATPIILTGLSVGFAFKTGLFNIGATGQMTVGAFAAVYIGVHWTFLPGISHWLVATLFAVLAGALWGLIPGILKAFFNVSEVVATIMLNYIAMYLVSLGVQELVWDTDRSRSMIVHINSTFPQFWLEDIFPDSGVTWGFFVAILVIVLIYILLNKTTIGFQLKAVGYNKDSAKYAGINEKYNVVLAMVIAGALAGLAGATIYLTQSNESLKSTYELLPQGFDGIAVSLLGLSNPIGIFFSGLFIAYITKAGFYMQTLSFEKEVIQIIISSIIYASALSVLFKEYIVKWVKKSKDKKEQEQLELAQSSEGGEK